MIGRQPLGAILSALVVATLMAPTGSVASTPPAASPTAVGGVRMAASTVPSICLHQATRGFWPTRARVQFVAKRVRVLALGRTSGGIPLEPPLTSSGKRSFGWDKKGPKPGSHRGNVRFNAHTYPDGSALGNWMLARLWVGARVIVKDGAGHAVCYKVTRRKRVLPRSYAARVAYYNTTGSPKLAMVVCSPPRLGPGNWKYRTIWYAKPSVS